MSNSIKNKVAIITGASSGFGEAMAEVFGDAGANLILIARSEEKLNKVAGKVAERGGSAVAMAADVNEPETFERALELANSRWGSIDILINNAGGGIKIAPIEQQSVEIIQQCISLNLTSAINACRIVVPAMKAQGSGLIINVGSACNKFAWPGWSVYSAAKTGLSMFSRCLYTELRPHGVGVTMLVPGGSNTGFQAAAGINSFDVDESNSLRAEHIAHAALSVSSMPKGAAVPEMVVYGLSQEIVPF